jgi:hypothetical protein
MTYIFNMTDTYILIKNKWYEFDSTKKSIEFPFDKSKISIETIAYVKSDSKANISIHRGYNILKIPNTVINYVMCYEFSNGTKYPIDELISPKCIVKYGLEQV